jgi:hypothetical protein
MNGGQVSNGEQQIIREIHLDLKQAAYFVQLSRL